MYIHPGIRFLLVRDFKYLLLWLISPDFQTHLYQRPQAWFLQSRPQLNFFNLWEVLKLKSCQFGSLHQNTDFARILKTSLNVDRSRSSNQSFSITTGSISSTKAPVEQFDSLKGVFNCKSMIFLTQESGQTAIRKHGTVFDKSWFLSSCFSATASLISCIKFSIETFLFEKPLIFFFAMKNLWSQNAQKDFQLWQIWIFELVFLDNCRLGFFHQFLKEQAISCRGFLTTKSMILSLRWIFVTWQVSKMVIYLAFFFHAPTQIFPWLPKWFLGWKVSI